MQSWMIGTVVALLAVGWLPQLPPSHGLWGLLALALAVSLRWRRPLTLLLLGLACGALYGAEWGRQLLEQRLPPQLEGRVLQLTGRILEPPQKQRFGAARQRQRFAFGLSQLEHPERPLAAPPDVRKVLLSYYGETPLRAGELWRFEVRLKRPWGLANPGSFNYQSWLSQQRFGATGSVRTAGARRLQAPPWWWRPHQRWRQQIAEQLERQHYRAGVMGVLLALSNGDRSAIDARTWRRLQRYGLNHLSVISGLHVGLVAALAFALLRGCGRRPAHVAAALAALAYAALAGFGLATVRALVMLGTVQLLALGNRQLSLWRVLLLALLAVSLLQPLASHNPGFWLSFAAVALIFYVCQQWPQLLGWRRLLLLQLALSGGIGLLASFWFGGSAWLAPLANLCAVPVLTCWLLPLNLLAALLAPLFPAGAAALWNLAAVPVTGLLQLDHWALAQQWPLWLDFRPAVGQLCLIVLAVLLLLAHRALTLFLPGLILLLTLLPTTPLRLARDELQIAVLDVGQGLAVYMQTARARLLYDTGGGDPQGANMAESVIVPYLQTRGVGQLELLVLSHSDRDHASGADSLHRRLQVDATWHGDALAAPLLRSRRCVAGAVWQRGALRLRALHPQRAAVADSNNMSCVLLLEFHDFRLLLAGDIERAVEQQLVLAQRDRLAADVLLVPHHGSATSSSSAFIKAVAPQLALVSAGYHNRFGHPHQRVVARYQLAGIPLLNTAQQGAILLRVRAGQVLQIDSWRRLRRRYWH